MRNLILGLNVLLILLKVTYASSSCSSAGSASGSCDFEGDVCNYDVGGWGRVTSYNKHTNAIDSAHNGTHFLVFDVSNSKVIATSPNIDPGEYCFSFWYYMTDRDVQLIVKTSSQHMIATIHDFSPITWKLYSFHIDEQDIFKIIFQVKLAHGGYFPHKKEYQTVGIDDIVVDRKAIGSSSTTVTVPHSSLGFDSCKSSVSRSECHFSSQSNCTLNSRWAIHQGNYALHGRTALLGSPENDGYFALLDAQAPAGGDNQTIVSQCLAAGTYCIQFWISSLRPTIHLEVLTRTNNGERNISLITHAGRVWAANAIQFTSHSNFQVSGVKQIP